MINLFNVKRRPNLSFRARSNKVRPTRNLKYRNRLRSLLALLVRDDTIKKSVIAGRPIGFFSLNPKLDLGSYTYLFKDPDFRQDAGSWFTIMVNRLALAFTRMATNKSSNELIKLSNEIKGHPPHPLSFIPTD